MAQVLIVADRSSAVIQPGQPPAQMAAWLMDVPAGSDALTVAKAFVKDQSFPLGTVVRVIDSAHITDPLAAQAFQLENSWVSIAW